jgi:hypothetical protein
MKNKKYYTVGTVPKCNRKTVERCTGTSIEKYVSCKAERGTPSPNVVLIIDGQTVASQTQTLQYTLTTINRSYDRKTVTCQANHADYSQNPMTVSAVIYLICK